MKSEFPLVITILKTFLTIHTDISIKSCERSFPSLRHLKTYIRTTICQDCLSNLAL